MPGKPKHGEKVKTEWGEEIANLLTNSGVVDPQPPTKPKKGDIIQPSWGEAVVDCFNALEPWINFGWRQFRSYVLSEDTQDWALDITNIPQAIAYLILSSFYNAHQTEVADLLLKDTSEEPRIVGGFYNMYPQNRGFSLCLGSRVGGGNGSIYALWYGANIDREEEGREDTDFVYSSGQLRFRSTHNEEPGGLIGRGSKVIILYWSL